MRLVKGKNAPRSPSKRVYLLPLTLFLIIVPLSVLRNSNESSPETSTSNSNITEIKRCDIFSGQWVRNPRGPYYNNETCYWIIDQQNCLKFGRPDREYLTWRWQPDECNLPLFNAAQFLKLLRGKSLAFAGDSVGRNQMQSLLCLLSGVAIPEDISLRYTSDDTYFRRFYYADYKFTLATLWSPYLVRTSDAEFNGHPSENLINLHLDEVDEAWAAEVEKFDYVIISAGQWFFRPLVFYENGEAVGCHKCQLKNITELPHYYGYRKAFRTAFESVINLKRYKGVTFLRTFSPSHFENGDWDKGGSCVRRWPFTKEEMQLDGYVLETYLTQMEEFRAAQREASKKGLQFRLMDTTEMMLLRPDGHPNNYGHPKEKNVTINDCVHWCLPGPIDTLNELLLYMLMMDRQTSSSSVLQRIF